MTTPPSQLPSLAAGQSATSVPVCGACGALLPDDRPHDCRRTLRAVALRDGRVIGYVVVGDPAPLPSAEVSLVPFRVDDTTHPLRFDET